MPSGKRNSIMAKVMGLIFSLFDATLSGDMPFGIPWYMQCTHQELTFVLLCVPFFLLTAQGVDSWLHFAWLSYSMFVNRNCLYFCGDWIDCRGDSNTVFHL